jgi:T4 RnlA family RNA ligase
MSPWQVQLYNDLVTLCNNEDRTFFYVDHKLEDKVYRVFAYHYATYADWQKPNALECRGAMFEMKDGAPVRLASLPMEKFFNVNENPFTQNLDFRQVVAYAEKMDGSLVSTFMHGPFLKLKSKTSIRSEQAVDAMQFLVQPRQMDLFRALQALASHGFTTNLEWTSPKNRIVVSYAEPKLTVLNVRFNASGEYVHKDAICQMHPELRRYWCVEHPLHTELSQLVDPIQYVKNLKGVEGFVLYFRNGLKAKLKSDWYVAMHRAKDTVSSERRLYEAIVEGGYDDLMSMWHEDEGMKNRILEMHRIVNKAMTGLAVVYTFYNDNKDLDRKSYALKGQADYPEIFHLLMQIYSGKEPDFKTHMIKNIDRYLPKGQLGDIQASSED